MSSAMESMAHAFRKAWNEADERGDKGQRVEAGLMAVFASLGGVVTEWGVNLYEGTDEDADRATLWYRDDEEYARHTAIAFEGRLVKRERFRIVLHDGIILSGPEFV